MILILGPHRIVDLGRTLDRDVQDFNLEFDNKAAGNRRSAIGKER